MFNTKHELTISEIKKKSTKNILTFQPLSKQGKTVKNKQKLITDDDQRRVKQAKIS